MSRLRDAAERGTSACRLLVVVALAGGAVAQAQPWLVDVTEASGVRFEYFSGMVGKLYFPEHMGGSVALFDLDGDGDLDLYLGQGSMLDDAPLSEALLPAKHPTPLTDRIYRNDGVKDGTVRFVDVTESANLASTTGYSMGVATGDYDRDGDVDLYLTQLGDNQLLRNRGDGSFEDVTEAAGANDRRWSVPASFFDYDGDGWLDLYVGNYVEFRVATHKNCASPQGAYDYCGPLAYAAEPNRLLRNRGDGTFEDATAKSLMETEGRTTLGSVAADFDGDGRIDLYVANDMMNNELWLNQGDGTFLDDADLLGAAVDRNGQAQASMGLVAGDLDGSGTVDLFMTHLQRENNTLYLNEGGGLFRDASRGSGLAEGSFPYTGFGTAILDADGDGIDDLFVANGAVRRLDDQVAAGDPHPLAEINQLYRGKGGGVFELVPAAQAFDVDRREVSRGVAVGDLDNDGDLDLVVSNNGGPARVLSNRSDPRRWLGLRLVVDGVGAAAGKAPVTEAIGALARVRSDDGRWWVTRRVHTDGSYAAASDPRLLWTLPGTRGDLEVEVTWPDGVVERFQGLGAAAYHTLRRGDGAAVASGSAVDPDSAER